MVLHFTLAKKKTTLSYVLILPHHVRIILMAVPRKLQEETYCVICKFINRQFLQWSVNGSVELFLSRTTKRCTFKHARMKMYCVHTLAMDVKSKYPGRIYYVIWNHMQGSSYLIILKRKVFQYFKLVS